MSYRFRLKTLLVAAAIAMAAPMGTPWAQEPVSGGKLQLAAPYGAALKSLDPHVSYNSQDMVVSKAFHRALYTWDSSNNAPALDLAKLVSTSEDGKTYTYELFDNIYFHNGRKLTTDDVIWSYTRVMDPTKGYPGSVQVGTLAGAKDYADGKAKEISGLKKIDDRTFSMTFSDFVDPGMLFFEAITAIIPREEVEGGNFLTQPVGLGPFSFVEHIEGSRISGKKFDKYYKQGKPYADAVDFTISDDTSALSA
ncbi:ABC transporter substrate-binding protein [Nordella sp. HKS 07]|nr:ABC transporter substrate-binding protein [Nordella sp. HKS 07]